MSSEHHLQKPETPKVFIMVARAKTNQVLTRLATELEDQGKSVVAKELREAAKSFYKKATDRDKKLNSSE